MINNDDDNGTFCIYPWIHLNTWPNGQVFQCCLTDWRNSIGNLENNTLEEIWNNDYMKDLRKRMLEGKKHWSCNKCYEQEEKGIISSRITANKNFAHHKEAAISSTESDGHNNDFKLVYWDFRFSNICNFKCRMCGSFLSSKWYEEEVKNGNVLMTEKVIQINNHIAEKNGMERYLNTFINDVEEIYFAGGEPLLMEEHYYILKRLVEAKNTDCVIRYNTNLSKLKYKKDDCLEHWKNFKTVKIFASIDDYGKRAEYARNGTVWKTVENNIKKILNEAPHVSLHTSTTINIWNIMYIPEIVDYLKNCGFDSYQLLMNNVLTNPNEYRINILPDNIKEQINNKFKKHLETMSDRDRQYFTDKYNSILLFLNETPDNIEKIRRDFKKQVIKLDRIRNEKFQEVFPELAEWFESIE